MTIGQEEDERAFQAALKIRVVKIMTLEAER